MKCKFIKKFTTMIAMAFMLMIPVVVNAAPVVNYTLVYDGKTHAYSAEEVYISVNGKDINTGDMPPVVINNRTLVPARAVFEAMGAEVMWNGTTSEVFVSKGNDVVTIKVGSNTGNKNGQNFTMDVPPMIINDRTVIPIRAVSEALNCNVEWNGETRYVVINEENKTSNSTDTSTSQPESNDSNSTTNVNPTGGSVTVSSISMPASGGAENYTINATGQISKYTTELISGNRLIVDIYDATMGISNDDITVTNSSFVSGIRSAQNQVTPQKITRVVFDLKTSNCDYSVGYTGDKKGVVVSFSQNEITGINLSSDGKTDTVTVTGKYTPVGSITKLTNPDRIVIDFANSISKLPESVATSGMNVITAARTGQYTANTTRVTLEVASGAEVSTSTSGNSFKVVVSKGTLENVSYNASTRTITLKKVQGMNINSIVHNDDYLNLKYTMTLPGNFTSSYGYGTYNVNDSYLTNFVIGTNSAGNTTITFNEKQITAYTITEDAANYYIKVQNPKEKYNCVVMLDAGHGGSDPGTNGNGFIEKNLNLEVLLKTYNLFENDGKDDIKVYVTRLSDVYPENADRARIANESADMFISIHMNSAAPNAVPNGTEVLYKTHSNEVSGKLTSEILAQTLQNNIINSIGTNNRGLKYRTDLLVLNSTTVPAVIIEAGFLSNLGDAQKVSDSATQQKIAQAIYNSVYNIYNSYKIR